MSHLTAERPHYSTLPPAPNFPYKILYLPPITMPTLPVILLSRPRPSNQIRPRNNDTTTVTNNTNSDLPQRTQPNLPSILLSRAQPPTGIRKPTNNDGWETELRTFHFNHKNSLEISRCSRLPNSTYNHPYEHRITHKNSLDLSTTKCPRSAQGKRRQRLQNLQRQQQGMQQEDLRAGCADPFNPEPVRRFGRERRLRYLPGYSDPFSEYYQTTRVSGSGSGRSAGNEKCLLKRLAKMWRSMKERLVLGGPAMKGSGVAPAL